MRVNIGFPLVRTDGRAGGRSVVRSVYGHVITKFSRMGDARGAPLQKKQHDLHNKGGRVVSKQGQLQPR